jgi:hypothetical protein
MLHLLYFYSILELCSEHVNDDLGLAVHVITTFAKVNQLSEEASPISQTSRTTTAVLAVEKEVPSHAIQGKRRILPTCSSLAMSLDP